MSVALEEGKKSNPKVKYARWIWRLFPHVFLIMSLIAFATLGALIFQQIENGNENENKNGKPTDESEDVQRVVRKVVETVQNHTGIKTFTHVSILY